MKKIAIVALFALTASLTVHADEGNRKGKSKTKAKKECCKQQKQCCAKVSTTPACCAKIK